MRLFLITICILLMTGCASNVKLGDNELFNPKVDVEKIFDTSGKEIVVDASKLQPVTIEEDELFQREFKDLFVNINLYNQLSQQGVKMNIKGEIISGLDKEVKRVLKGKKVEIKTLTNGAETVNLKTF